MQAYVAGVFANHALTERVLRLNGGTLTAEIHRRFPGLAEAGRTFVAKIDEVGLSTPESHATLYETFIRDRELHPFVRVMTSSGEFR